MSHSGSGGVLDKQEVDEAWAEASYAAPFAMGLLENEFVRKAILKTSQLFLPASAKNHPETMPGYEPPKVMTGQ